MHAAQLFTDVSGWLIALLLATTITLQYEARRPRFLPSSVQPLQLHYWIGYAIVLLTTAHTLIPMRPEIAGRANRHGLYIATIALALLLVQFALGLLLKKKHISLLAVLRRVHFWNMVVLCGFALGHMALNATR